MSQSYTPVELMTPQEYLDHLQHQHYGDEFSSFSVDVR